MGHRGATVHDDPFAVVLTLGAQDSKTRRLHRIADAGGQGLGLSVAGARSDDDPLKQWRQVFGIEDTDVLGLDVLETVDDGALQLADVH